MRKLISLMTVVGIFAGGVWAHAEHGASTIEPFNEELPWPLGSEIDFPWEDIEGVWMGERTDRLHVTYFSLRVREESRSERLLEIHELVFNSKHARFEIQSQGKGFENERVVRGQMLGVSGKSRYRFSIRAFEESEKRGKGGQQITRVLQVAPIDPTDRRSQTFVLYRMSRTPIQE